MPAERPILLVAPHPNDGIVSIDYFGECLHGALSKKAPVDLTRPRAQFARLAPAGTSAVKWLAYLDKFALFPSVLRRAAANSRLVHFLDQSCAIHSLRSGLVQQLATCTDMIAVRSAAGENEAHRTRWSGRQLQKLVLAGLGRCDHVACISEATRTEVLRFAGLDASRLSVVPMGLRRDFARVETAGLSRKRVRGRYVLHVGGNQWYKNRRGVLRIFAEVARAEPNLQLVLAGRPLSLELTRLAGELGCLERILVVEDCTDTELEELYSAAELLLFPSLQEGFGWPIIEAQACGCPVAASNRAPMTEVGGKAAIYIEPENCEAAAAKVRGLLEFSAEARAKLVCDGMRNAARFSRDAMAEQYFALYAALLDRGATQAAPFAAAA